MDLEQFIEAAIKKGAQSGARVLDPLQRAIFLLSELEALCDADGSTPSWIATNHSS